MAASSLTAERLRSLVSYNQETGLFYRIVKTSNRANMCVPAGCLSHGYVVFHIGNVLYHAHRLAWLHVTGSWPKEEIDHINGNRSDNRFCNLRECTSAQNNQNFGIRSDNKRGLTGVHLDKRDGVFYGRIKLNNKIIHLGRFKTAEEAHAAYVEAKSRLHTFQPTIRA